MKIVVLDVEQSSQGVIDLAVRCAVTPTTDTLNSCPGNERLQPPVAIKLLLTVSKD
jgi:hypothetical protein